MREVELKIKILRDNAVLPAYATEGAAAMDLRAAQDRPVAIAPGKSALIPTGLAIGLPSSDYVALVFARSGLAVKKGIALSNGVGVIDSDYTGELQIGLINQSDTEFVVNPGDRIAQLAVMPVCRASLAVTDSLEPTARGGGGFGSTGIK
jgi:dUTP pyrophosphatase